jgi:hypothetical protein
MRDEHQPQQRPRIVAVDHDTTTRALLADELDSRYGRHCDIVLARSSHDGRAFLSDGSAAT